MTPEQKRKVPRHLRGAGVRRYWCQFCDTYHGHTPAQCKKNPRYAEYRENNRKAAQAAGLKSYHENGGREKLEVATRKMWEDPARHRQAAEAFRKINKKLKRTGKHNPFYGRKHTLETRLKMSRTQLVSQNVLKDDDREKVLPPVFRSDAFDFFHRPKPGDRDEFSAGQTEVWESDEFDPFH